MASNYAATYTANLESQTRYRLDMAARPVLNDAERAQSLAQAMLAAKDAGRLDEARAFAEQLKPLMWLIGANNL